ncbi:hypothetical protein [Priestia megaterium]|uniref:hypothetical protein n=1 Tax=Priestia megaterium TaxID=1404 RepID=UPI00159BC0D7|nr:hypothetical protein [Priestia megaterium]
MTGGQDEDSCRKIGTGETPQSASEEEAQRSPAESKALHGNQQRCHKRSILAPLSHLSLFRLN